MHRVVRRAELANGLTLPYAEQGDPDGPALVLLHGPVDSWEAAAPVLAELPASIRAFAPTQRGHAGVDRPHDRYAPQDFADDVAAFLDAVGVERAVIAGHSGAGHTALRFALDHPERTRGVVLIATPPSLRDHPAFTDLLDEIRRLTDPVDPGFVRAFVGSTMSAAVPTAFLDAVLEQSCRVPARVWHETFAGLLETPDEEALGAVEAPALLLWGDEDGIVTREHQERLLSLLPHARLVVIEGAGHSPHWEQPARAAAALAAFTRSLPA